MYLIIMREFHFLMGWKSFAGKSFSTEAFKLWSNILIFIPISNFLLKRREERLIRNFYEVRYTLWRVLIEHNWFTNRKIIMVLLLPDCVSIVNLDKPLNLYTNLIHYE